MKRRMLLWIVLALTLSTFIYAGNALGEVWYVDNNASPGGDGCSWQTAFSTVQAGLDAASAGHEVWVKQGTYCENIFMKDGVALYGGFAGTESSLLQRNWNAFETVLDGSQSGSVITIDNAVTYLTRIDGFTITNGLAYNGGGIYINGGGNYTIIENNNIQGNVATGEGGGIYIPSSYLIVKHNIITGNTAFNGGGIRFYSCGPTISHNVINGNIASSNGGGIYGFYVHGTTKIFNNAVSGNSSETGGGLYLAYSTVPKPLIFNNNIIGNKATQNGGGIYIWYLASQMYNNIVAYCSDGIYALASTYNPTLKNNNFFMNMKSDYQGISPGVGDISADPMLVYHLNRRSPCIESGDNTPYALGYLTTDMDGDSRLIGTYIDIGVDEFVP